MNKNKAFLFKQPITNAMTLEEVVKVHGSTLHIRFNLTKYTFFATEIGGNQVLTLHDIEKKLKIKDLKKQIKANIEDNLEGKKVNLSKLFDKFNEIMKKKILPFSC